jgi:hypothetical protein
MADADWKFRRLWAIESKMFNDGIHAASSTDQFVRLESTFSSLAATPKLPLLQRYETSLDRLFQRQLASLFTTRRHVPLDPPEPRPEPPSEPGSQFYGFLIL